ncbi:MAG TPA: hypothetical protein VMV29_22505 [Ktedonobacterales bacterium]|nr:hypothetical protein [Ktedonobacterales bacterium]
MPFQLLWQRLRYELRILGIINIGLPIIVAAIYLGFSYLAGSFALRNGGTDAYMRFQAGRGLLALLENGLPLAGGLIAAVVISQNPALELHLSLPACYQRVGALRLALIVGWAALFTGAVAALVAVTGFWLPQLKQLSVVESALMWLAPLLWFIAAGAALALLLRSRAVSGAVLGLIWIAMFIFKDQLIKDPILQNVYLFLTEEVGTPSYWLANRLIVLAIALALFVLAFWLLGRNEALLHDEA